jgi:3'-5' exoribonuclease
MKPPFIKDLEAGQQVTASFLVHSKEVREKKTGDPYLSLLLSDKTGKIDGKMWDNVAEVMDSFDRDDFVKIKGLIQIHMNRPQITIHKVRKMDDAEVNFGDYFPCSARDREEMWSELCRNIAEVQNLHLRAMLQALADDEDIARRLKVAPAAKSIHHAYLGGLLEHILSLCTLGKLASSHYKLVDPDLMVAAAVLHDIGKIHELSYDRGFHYTPKGQLLGHMAIALRMIGDKLRNLPDFPEGLRTLLEHIVLSHHGSLEFGSPKLPQFAEAILFHYLDDMDSKMEVMRAALATDQGDALFTSYMPSIERSLLKKQDFLNPPAKVEAVSVLENKLDSAKLDFEKPDTVKSVHPPVSKPPVNSAFASKLASALRPE